MKKSSFGKMLMVLLAVILLVASLPISALAEDVKVTPSKESYAAKVWGGATFICNSTPIDTKVGTKMYMTYTVKNLTTVPVQQGVAACSDAYQAYPYQNGGLLYWGGVETMVRDGYTYFVEFTVTEKGFEYVAAHGKEDGKLQYVSVSNKAGDGTADMKYMGLWIDGAAELDLSNIHFYTADGTDLGITTKGGVLREYTVATPKATDVPHAYELEVKGLVPVRFANKLKNTTDKMYVEFTVERNKDSKVGQIGYGINGRSMEDQTQYKYQYDYVTYNAGILLTEGASFLLEFSNTHSDAAGWDLLIQRTMPDGTVDWSKANNEIGTKTSENLGFSYIIFTEGSELDFKLKDLKIYDANHKSLGVAVMGTAVTEFVHYGHLESYADCDFVYYSKATNTYVAIYPDNSIKVTKDGVTKEGTYFIEDAEKATLTADFNGKIEKYEFTRAHLIDADGNKLMALGEYKVKFVTGTDIQIPEQKLSNKTGYVVQKPADPTLDGDEFVCWVTRDGKEYKFDGIQTESLTLYAKWEKDSGKTYTAIDVKVEKEKMDFTPYIAIGAAVLIVAITAVGFVFMIRRFKKK